MNRHPRPLYLNLLEFRFPAAAITSLLHRLSGGLLFLALPFLIYGLEHSLQGDAGIAQLHWFWAQLPVRLAVALMAWALLHHWLAGWRLLLIEVDAGADIVRARFTARLVNAVSLAGLVIFVGMAL